LLARVARALNLTLAVAPEPRLGVLLAACACIVPALSGLREPPRFLLALRLA